MTVGSTSRMCCKLFSDDLVCPGRSSLSCGFFCAAHTARSMFGFAWPISNALNAAVSNSARLPIGMQQNGQNQIPIDTAALKAFLNRTDINGATPKKPVVIRYSPVSRRASRARRRQPNLECSDSSELFRLLDWSGRSAMSRGSITTHEDRIPTIEHF